MRRNRSVGLDFARPLVVWLRYDGRGRSRGCAGLRGGVCWPGIRPIARFGLSPAANCRYRLGHGLGSSARRRLCRVPVLIWPGIGLGPEAIAAFRPFASRHSPALAGADREFPALGLP